MKAFIELTTTIYICFGTYILLLHIKGLFHTMPKLHKSSMGYISQYLVLPGGCMMQVHGCGERGSHFFLSRKVLG